MKNVRGMVLILTSVLILGLAIFVSRFRRPQPKRDEARTLLAQAAQAELHPDVLSPLPTGRDSKSNSPPRPFSIVKRSEEFTEAEREALAAKFQEKFQPALAGWVGIYKERVPFKVEDVTLDKFHSRVGNNSYTFVLGDITLTFLDSKNGARVNYMSSRQGLMTLSTIPKLATPPDISMPATRSEVLQLLVMDSGVTYPPNQVEINATGKSSALMGGMSVEAGGILGNGIARAITPTNLDFTLGPDGKLVEYLH